jgi:hypothetical protein
MANQAKKPHKLPHMLPVFEGYTIDVRLGEFRKVTWTNGEPSMETVSFLSPEGQELLSKCEEGL